MRVLLIGYYSDPDYNRSAELEYALQWNLAHAPVDKIYALIEDKSQLPEHPKLQPVPVGSRLKFVDFFAFAGAFPGQTVIIANNDIRFDNTLNLIDRIDLTDTFVCLSRTEPHGGSCEWGPANGQDAWIFRSPAREFPCEWDLGQDRCDGRLAAEAARAGYKLVNPYPHIHAYHEHASRIRRRTWGRRVPGPYLAVQPTAGGLP